MAELRSMRNIGREMARKLAAVGIDTPDKLREAGSAEAFFRLKVVFPEICLVHLYALLVHLYALEGAIEDLDYNRLPENRRLELKAFSDQLRGR